MNYRLQQVRVLPENMMKMQLKRAAHIFNEFIDCDLLIVYRQSKASPFDLYEFMVKKDHFQHLAGVKYPKGAELFFDKCFEDIISMRDIVPRENIKTTSSKIEVLPQAIDLCSARIYKIGEKDLETQYNRFSMGIGNSSSVLGLDQRDERLPIPVTVMNRKITDFCSESYPIFLILKKNFKQKKYNQLVFERTQDIFSKIDFGDEIVDKIDFEALV